MMDTHGKILLAVILLLVVGGLLYLAAVEMGWF